MKKGLIILAVLMALLLSLSQAIEIESGDRIYLSCQNATSPFELLGTTGTLTCYDSSGNTDVSGEALTNVAAGKFYYTFSETNDRYYCYIDCTSTGTFDYEIPVWQRTTPVQTSDIPSAEDNADATWDEAQAGHVGAGTFGEIATETAGILLDTDDLEADANDGFDISNSSINTMRVAVERNVTQNLTSDHGSGAWTTADTSSLATQSSVNGLNESVYNYFTSGSNEDQFKADVSSLATSVELASTEGTLETAISDNVSSSQSSIENTITSARDDVLAGVESNGTAIISDIAVAQTDLDNPDQYKADISSLATSIELSNVQVALEQAISGNFSALNDITVADIFSYSVSVLSMSFEQLVTDLHNITVTQQDGFTANWSDKGISSTDITSIATEVVNTNISAKCPFNSSSFDDSLGQYISCGYKYGWV
jgi:hypothetical protein